MERLVPYAYLVLVNHAGYILVDNLETTWRNPRERGITKPTCEQGNKLLAMSTVLHLNGLSLTDQLAHLSTSRTSAALINPVHMAFTKNVLGDAVI